VQDREERGFTLLELLIVIAIIAVLLGFIFPVFQGVQDRARKVQAKNDLTQIVTAVNAFYTEYGRYPINSTTPADTYFGSASAPSGSTSGGSNDVLVNELRACGSGTPSCPAAATINTRLIAFISPILLSTGATRSGVGSNGQYFDPWGTPYNIEMDGNYDNQLPNPYSANNGAGPAILTNGVIGWSLGKDTQPGNKGDQKFTNSDDVISWQ
jgi:prepilin-type N-terminal cleavage/methylation domain-containing protein